MSTNTIKRKTKFPELPPKYSSSRELRNKAEKIRRDRLNGLIDEMKMNQKSEKTRSNILRLTANYLKVSQIFGKKYFESPQVNQVFSTATPEQTMNVGSEGLQHLQSLDGFFFLLSSDGKILFISENSIKYVGYSQVDLLGMSIYDFTHPTDRQKIQSFITWPESGGEACLTDDSKGPRRSFYIRFREKPGMKRDLVQYEHMNVVGHIKTLAGASQVFVGLMRPVKDRPITELSLMEASQDQYLTRHLPDGRIIYTDHRISTIAGYMPSEVNGKSAFNFFYAEDLPWTTMAMRNMFASSSGEGSTVYRLFTNTGELICLQTKGFLEYNKETKKIESFLCINTLIRSEDEARYLNEQKEKFTPYISELQNSSNMKHLELEDLSEPKGLKSGKISVISTLFPAELSEKNTDIHMNRISSVRGDNRGNHQSQGLKRKFEDQKSPSKAVSNLQYRTARDLPVYRFEDGVRIIDVDQSISLPSSSRESPPRKKGHLDFEDLINSLNTSISTPSTNDGSKTETQPRSRSVIKKLPKSNIAGTTEIEIINEELQHSLMDRMENQKPPSRVGECHSEMAAVTKQNSQDCNVSDLMEILDNDLFNPRLTEPPTTDKIC